MRLVTFRYDGSTAVGALVDGKVIHLPRAYAGYLSSQGTPLAYLLAEAQMPGDILPFLAAGERALVAAERAIEYVKSMSAATPGPRGPRGERLSFSLDEVALLAPIPRPGKILCIGLNYRDHAEEIGLKLPERPVLFSKYSSCVIGPGEPIVIPSITDKVDYEAELAVVIGKTAKGVEAEKALDYVAGYTLMNDVSARDAQMGDKQWVRGKSFDTFGPMGPALVTKDEIADPGKLGISLRLNGQVMQNSNTSNLVFGVPELIAFLSQAITLEPGDVIATGTPGGVGTSRKPQVFLKAGDVVVVDVEGVGALENPVVAER
ncbi:MAG: fumarylacetoacetate hydrolase family protein [Chloroflexota bacterium]|jgi:acylpyruvate hydrolase